MLLALLVAGLAAAPGAHAARVPASLAPARISPLEVKGRNFRRRERVRVTITPSVGRKASRRVRARRDGSFRLAFHHVPTCGGVEGVAVGRRGSRASFQLSTARGCD